MQISQYNFLRVQISSTKNFNQFINLPQTQFTNFEVAMWNFNLSQFLKYSTCQIRSINNLQNLKLNHHFKKIHNKLQLINLKIFSKCHILLLLMYQNIKAQKGIPYDSDDSEPDVPQQRKTGGPSLGAMDSLLFGAFKPTPKKESKVEVKKEVKVEVKKETPPPPPKVVEKPAVVKPAPPAPKPVQVKPPPQVIPKQPVRIPIPPPQDEDLNRIPQPQPYYYPSGIPQNQAIIPVSDELFNRPGYIRKLKKVADNFDFNKFNKKNTQVLDVLRLSECYYDEIKKRREAEFRDYQFPSNYSAFVDNTKEKNLGSFIDYNVWKSAGESFKGPCFGKYIDPNDIQRGAFHSQYLVSCLASLAENEANIKRLIQEQQLNKSHFYYVRVNENGVWRYIVVDDQVPSENNGKLAISHSYSDVQTELWPSLIEKAYTKVYGTFQQYSRNQSRQSYLRDLTGAPVRTYLPNSPGLSDRVKKAIESGFVVQAVPSPKIQQKGLNPNLTLSVIGVTSRGSYEIRSAFGTLDQKSKFSISKEGVFELNQADANQNIAYFMIAEIQTGYATSTVECKMKRSFYSSYSFKVKNDFHGYLTISQFDERLFPNSHNVFTDKSKITIPNPSDYSYSPVRALIYRRQRNGDLFYVNSGYSERKAFDVQVNLDAGEYVIILLALWNADWHDINFSLYGSELVAFKKLYNKFDSTIIARGLQEESLRNGTKNSRGGVEEIVYLHEPSGLIVVTLNNTSGKETRHTKDMSRAKIDSLFLLSSKGKDESLSKLVESDLKAYKEGVFGEKQWWIDLQPNQKWSWVFATQGQFDDNSFRSLGGK